MHTDHNPAARRRSHQLGKISAGAGLAAGEADDAGAQVVEIGDDAFPGRGAQFRSGPALETAMPAMIGAGGGDRQKRRYRAEAAAGKEVFEHAVEGRSRERREEGVDNPLAGMAGDSLAVKPALNKANRLKGGQQTAQRALDLGGKLAASLTLQLAQHAAGNGSDAAVQQHAGYVPVLCHSDVVAMTAA